MLLDMRLQRNRWTLALFVSAGLGSGPGALQAIEGVRLFEGTLVLPPGDVAEAQAELPPGEYVVGWRWDCEESSQVWTSCSDVTIKRPAAEA